jgi:prepilin-type N-terminal cleavage/methylation domain-containing protein
MQKLMKAMHNNEKGFTLVELMVVVVIIGILVAIAIPIYNNVTANAKRNTVEANLRTIDGSIQIYAAETGSLPTLADGSEIAGDYLTVWPSGPDATTYDILIVAGAGGEILSATAQASNTGNDAWWTAGSPVVLPVSW